MRDFFVKIIPVILIFILGFFLKRMKIFDKKAGDTFLKFVFFVSLPALVFLSVSRLEISKELIYLPFIAAAVLFLSYFISLLISAKMNLGRKLRGTFLIGSMIMNTSFTIPFVYNTRIYDLPDDIYAWNSVSQVSFVGGDRIPHGHATDKVLRLFYYIIGDKIYFSGDLWADIELIYKAKLPRLLSVSDTPSLPSMCEGFLTSFVERKMQAVNSSSDVNNANVFTKEEKAIITDVFSSNSADISEIPIVRDIYYDDY
jgi:hypothetical protein